MKKKFTFLMTAMALIFAMMTPRGAWGQTKESTTVVENCEGSSASTGWSWTNITAQQTAITAHSGSYYLSNGSKTTASVQYSSKVANPVSFTCYYSKTSNNTNNSSYFVIQVSSDGNSWTDVQKGKTMNNVTKGTWYELTAELSSYQEVFVRVFYTGTNAARALDDISLTYSSGTTPTVAAPTFTPAGGEYVEAQTVTLSCVTEGATIHYTTDGTEPSADSTPYESAITVDHSMTIKAIAIKGTEKSTVATAAYKINVFTSLEDLVAAEIADGTTVKVSFENVMITNIYTNSSDKRVGIFLNVKAKNDKDIEIYFNNTAEGKTVPDAWIVGGKVSGTLTCPWTYYKNGDVWELCPDKDSEWTWGELTYTAPTQQLPAPTNLTFSNLSMTGATLSWNAVEHASSYTVHVTGSDAYENTIENIETTSVVLGGLTAGKEYMWTVKAIGDGVTYLESDESETADFTTPITVLYTVNFDTQQTGGTIEIDPIQAAAGEEVIALATAADHYSFTQWNFSPAVTISDGDITEKEIIFIMPESAVTVTATFTEEAKYTVTYAKGGDDVEGEDPETVSYYEDDVVILAENPYTRIGFTFNDWEVKDAEENDVTVDEGMFEMPASNVTVTATWAEKTPATITLKDKGAQYGETINGYVGDNLLATLADVVNPTGLPSMTDYTFAGWAQAKDTENPNIATTETTIADDITLYAVYANVIPGTTTYQKVSNLTDIVNGRWVIVNDGYALPSTTTTLSPVKNDNYKVTITDNQISSIVGENMIWNFTFSEGKATVKNNEGSYLYATNSNSGLRVSNTSDTWTFETNSIGFAMKESNNSRYCATYTSDWRSYTSANHGNYGDGGILYLYKENTTPGTTIYDFEESAKIYTVTYDANGAEGDVPVEAMFFAQGDEYTLASAEGLTKEHHTFAGWMANTDGQTYDVGSIYTFGEANVTFTAQWNEEQKLTVSYHANGIVSSEDVFAGEIQLTAPENVPNGYSYVGWTTTPIEGVAQSATYFSSYNVTENVDLYAVFAIAIGGGTTSVTKDIIAEAGIIGTVTLNETAYQIGNLPIQLTATKGTSNWPVINYNAHNGNDLRFYKSSSSVTFATTNNSTITKIEFKKNESTASDLKTYFSVNVGTLSSNVWTGSAESVTITYSYATDNFKEQMYIINVTYSETSVPTYSNFCTTVSSPEIPAEISGNVTIPSGAAYTLTSSITITSGAKLTVNGALGNTDPEKLIIKDGGQLVFNNSGSSKDGDINSGVKATVEKNIIPYSSSNKDGEVPGWHFLAAPMEDFEVTSFIEQAGEGEGHGYDLYRWYIKDNGDPIWYNYKAHHEEAYNEEAGTGFEPNFLSGRGYLAAYETTDLLKMQGTLNAGTTFSFTEELNSKGNFTLLGNPFTYYLKWSDFTMENVYDKGFAVVDSENGIIEYVAGDDVNTIKVGTGFMVYTEDDGAELSFTKDSGSGKSNDILALNLFASNGNGEDNTIIVIDDENGGFAKADNLNTNAPQIYTERLQTKYGIRNFNTSTKEFNVSFKAAGEGSNTIRLETIGEFDYVHLYDKLLDVDVDMLLEGSYTFEASEGDDTHRFIVRIDKGNTGIDENETENFVNVYNGEIHVSGSGEVQIFDVMGRMVHSEVISGDATISTGGFKGGVYVVRLIGNGWTKTEKIVVRR